jgi:transcriptional regulator with XRE-family HTH domain
MNSRALRLVRIFHRLKQTDLADKLEISNSYLSEIESGVKSPSVELLGKYSTIFRIPVSTLLLFSERLDEKKFSERVRVQAGDKILRMLEWVAESEHFENDRTTRTPS